MQYEHMLETAPIFMLLIDDRLRIVYRSRVAGLVLGTDAERALHEVMDVTAVADFEELRDTLLPGETPVHRLVTFFGRYGTPQKVAGLVDRGIGLDGAPLLRFTACYDSRCEDWLAELIRSEEVLRGFARTASEAMWCIEFSEPVDITLGDAEIVRQVFENDCHWLLCNEALARIYRLPRGLDINHQPVAHYFPRSPENEAFILRIIHAPDFAVDNATSIDFRHDGSALYMENNVRCSIVNGYLIRILGTLRDVTRLRQTQIRLKDEADAVRNILSALPDAILVIDRDRQLLAVNPSFETLFGWDVGVFLGRDVQSIIDLEQPLSDGWKWRGSDVRRWQTTVRTKFDTFLCCEAQIAPIGDEAPHHFVLSLRPVVEPEKVLQERCDA
ncbi:MAG: PAS domain-containing protein [Zoogloeaceae bacterium]|jgi:PAS domain S-box-containing protein|nr:PAS domain-containing protein [Zoogloeaceae bacterium]